MLEDHEFCDDCPGCRPALLDLDTKQPLASDHPTMKLVNEVWDDESSYAERKAFIEVTLHNSKIPVEIKLFQQLWRKIQVKLDKDEEK